MKFSGSVAPQQAVGFACARRTVQFASAAASHWRSLVGRRELSQRFRTAAYVSNRDADRDAVEHRSNNDALPPAR